MPPRVSDERERVIRGGERDGKDGEAPDTCNLPGRPTIAMRVGAHI